MSDDRPAKRARSSAPGSPAPGRPDALGSKGAAPLHSFAAEGKEDAIRLAARDRTVDMDVADANGYTPLLFAVRKGHPHVVRFLLSLGDRVDPNRARSDGVTPLIRAAEVGGSEKAEEVLKLLLNDPRVNVNARVTASAKDKPTKAGDTALHVAARAGHAEFVHRLLEHPDLNVTVANDAGETAADLVPDDADGSLAPTKQRLQEAVARDRLKAGARLRISNMKLDYHGDLVLGKELGRGGFGVAYEAELRAGSACTAMPNGGRVAVKIELKPWEDKDFEKEVILWAHAGSHENIVALLGYCESPKAFVSQLVEGHILAHHLFYLWRPKKGPKPTAAEYHRASALLLLDIARAIEYLHDVRHLVHGDLKGDNAFVSAGPRPRALLADFGLSRIRIDGSYSKPITREPPGGWPFKAPEMLALQPQKARKPTDVYAFAMLIYIAGSGGYEPFYKQLRAKYEDLTPDEQDEEDARVRGLKAAVRTPPPEGPCRPKLPPEPAIPGWNMPRMPDGMRKLMEDCWAHEQEKRPTMAEVVARLEGMLAPGGELAAPTT
ncbi:kinase-like domain-containing protein [Hyaloraphidium curvatum]|nr:kinase-like domain-containing protein [Hyaloraphidium curvatum]